MSIHPSEERLLWISLCRLCGQAGMVHPACQIYGSSLPWFRVTCRHSTPHTTSVLPHKKRRCPQRHPGYVSVLGFRPSQSSPRHESTLQSLHRHLPALSLAVLHQSSSRSVQPEPSAPTLRVLGPGPVPASHLALASFLAASLGLKLASQSRSRNVRQPRAQSLARDTRVTADSGSVVGAAVLQAVTGCVRQVQIAT